MRNRRNVLAAIAALALVAVSSASGVEIDGYTATGAPSHVRPSTPTSYTIALTNTSSTSADRASIGIPLGFRDVSKVLPTATCGSASPTLWTVESPVPSADGKINVSRQGSSVNNLCPGGTLSIEFSSTSAAVEGNYVWVTELFRGEEDQFILDGPQPTVQVDGTDPIVSITQKPPAASNSSSASFGFLATDESEPVGYLCKLDAEAPVACASGQGYSALSDGPHTFTVIAIDAAGNSGEASHAWTIETEPPSAAITQKPGDPTNSRGASFAFAASEPATFQCKLDDGPFTACSSPQVYGDLADGRHTFVLRVTDAASNVGPHTAYAWTIDTRAPAVAVTSGPTGLTNSSTATLSFSADEPSTFQCSVDGRGFEPCSSPAAYGGLSDGGHAFAVRATDAAGNVGAASRSWTVDATAPQTTLDSKPAARTTATAARFTFSASEPATFQCRLGAGSFSPCGSPKTYRGLARGLHRFSVRAIDPAGNVDATPAAAGWTVGRRITRTVATSALLAPASGARVTRPPLLRWRAVSRATYYNVQLYRAGRKVLTAWPTRTRLQLGARWTFNKRVQRLAPGVYRWYVWPGYGKASARRYGRLLGTSTFVVVRGAPRR